MAARQRRRAAIDGGVRAHTNTHTNTHTHTHTRVVSYRTPEGYLMAGASVTVDYVVRVPR